LAVAGQGLPEYPSPDRKEAVQRVVALIVVTGQATNAFARAAFGVSIAEGTGAAHFEDDADPLLLAGAMIQANGIASVLSGWRRYW
jgi:hypothetical protein